MLKHYPVFIIMTEIQIQKIENSDRKDDDPIDHHCWLPQARLGLSNEAWRDLLRSQRKDPRGWKGTEFAPQYMSLWHRIILGWLFLRNRRRMRISKIWVEVTLLKETFTFIREISICKGVSLCSMKGERTKSLETLVSGEGNWLKCA